ncbi:MAG TPA: carboxypeptidase-like regulatory domain-containing protein, partial [Pirellulales bacterium]|nr:carboxypeptidase-like regulatory domain-containing protein [Pirellulales bacterium]
QRIGPRLRKPCSSATCDEDGRYTIPVLPGPGILAYRFGPYSRATYREYMSASLSKEEVAAFYESAGLKPPPDTTDDRVLVSTGTQTWSSIAPSSYNHVELIDPAEGEASLTRNVELMPGRTLEVKVVGPDGQPMAGARVRGAGNSAFEIDKFDKAEFTVTGLNPRIERKLIVELPEQRLAAFRLLRGEQVGPLVINLGPCGVVTGRMLDAEGKPLENTLLQFGRQWSFPADFTPKTDVDGKFRVDGLVPGLPYGITLKLPGKVGMSRPAQDIVVAAGERKDLGDVRLNPRK